MDYTEIEPCQGECTVCCKIRNTEDALPGPDSPLCIADLQDACRYDCGLATILYGGLVDFLGPSNVSLLDRVIPHKRTPRSTFIVQLDHSKEGSTNQIETKNVEFYVISSQKGAYAKSS